jgi:hypothetical protein
MTSTPDTSDKVIPERPSADPVLSGQRDAAETTDRTAEKVSPPPVIISEHEVLLGTAAALTVAPSFEGELDSQDADIETAHAERPAAPRRHGWIAALARRIAGSRGGRPQRRHYPSRFDQEFIADARMDREMYRL